LAKALSKFYSMEYDSDIGVNNIFIEKIEKRCWLVWKEV